MAAAEAAAAAAAEQAAAQGAAPPRTPDAGTFIASHQNSLAPGAAVTPASGLIPGAGGLERGATPTFDWPTAKVLGTARAGGPRRGGAGSSGAPLLAISLADLARTAPDAGSSGSGRLTIERPPSFRNAKGQFTFRPAARGRSTALDGMDLSFAAVSVSDWRSLGPPQRTLPTGGARAS